MLQQATARLQARYSYATAWLQQVTAKIQLGYTRLQPCRGQDTVWLQQGTAWLRLGYSQVTARLQPCYS